MRVAEEKRLLSENGSNDWGGSGVVEDLKASSGFFRGVTTEWTRGPETKKTEAAGQEPEGLYPMIDRLRERISSLERKQFSGTGGSTSQGVSITRKPEPASTSNPLLQVFSLPKAKPRPSNSSGGFDISSHQKILDASMRRLGARPLIARSAWLPGEAPISPPPVPASKNQPFPSSSGITLIKSASQSSNLSIPGVPKLIRAETKPGPVSAILTRREPKVLLSAIPVVSPRRLPFSSAFLSPPKPSLPNLLAAPLEVIKEFGQAKPLLRRTNPNPTTKSDPFSQAETSSNFHPTLKPDLSPEVNSSPIPEPSPKLENPLRSDSPSKSDLSQIPDPYPKIDAAPIPHPPLKSDPSPEPNLSLNLGTSSISNPSTRLNLSSSPTASFEKSQAPKKDLSPKAEPIRRPEHPPTPRDSLPRYRDPDPKDLNPVFPPQSFSKKESPAVSNGEAWELGAEGKEEPQAIFFDKSFAISSAESPAISKLSDDEKCDDPSNSFGSGSSGPSQGVPVEKAAGFYHLHYITHMDFDREQTSEIPPAEKKSDFRKQKQPSVPEVKYSSEGSENLWVPQGPEAAETPVVEMDSEVQISLKKSEDLLKLFEAGWTLSQHSSLDQNYSLSHHPTPRSFGSLLDEAKAPGSTHQCTSPRIQILETLEQNFNFEVPVQFSLPQPNQPNPEISNPTPDSKTSDHLIRPSSPPPTDQQPQHSPRENTKPFLPPKPQRSSSQALPLRPSLRLGSNTPSQRQKVSFLGQHSEITVPRYIEPKQRQVISRPPGQATAIDLASIKPFVQGTSFSSLSEAPFSSQPGRLLSVTKFA